MVPWSRNVVMFFVIAAGAGCVTASKRDLTRYGDKSDSALEGWPDWSNVSTNEIIDKYGAPTRMEADRLVWENRGPWKRISVWDEMGYLTFNPTPSNIQQTISYHVPRDQRRPLRRFSKNIMVSYDGEELSSRSGSEDVNFLTINLADEIIRGVKTPEEARDFYKETIKLHESGKPTPYMQQFLFSH